MAVAAAASSPAPLLPSGPAAAGLAAAPLPNNHQHHALQAFLVAAVVAPFSFYAGEAAARLLRLPRITGFLASGIALGPYALSVLSSSSVADLSAVEGACLAVIGVAAGAELKIAELARHRRAVVALTFSICLSTWLLCFAAIVLLAGVVRPSVLRLDGGVGGTGEATTAAATAPLLPFASLAATLAMARSPASAVAVLRELDARGPFSSTVMGVTVLKDVVVIVAFAVNVQLVATAAAEAAKRAAAGGMAAVAKAAGAATGAGAAGGVLWAAGGEPAPAVPLPQQPPTAPFLLASASRLLLLPLLSVAVSVSVGVVGGLALSAALSRPWALRLSSAATRAFGGGGHGGRLRGGGPAAGAPPSSSGLDRAGLPLAAVSAAAGGGGGGDDPPSLSSALARTREVTLLLLATAVFTLTHALNAEPLLACVAMGLVAGNRPIAQLFLGGGGGAGGAGGGGVLELGSVAVRRASDSAGDRAINVVSDGAAVDAAGGGGVDGVAGGDGSAAAAGDDADAADTDDDSDGEGRDHGDHPGHDPTAAGDDNVCAAAAHSVMNVTNVAFFGLAGASLQLPAVLRSAWLAGALVLARLLAIRVGCAAGAALAGGGVAKTPPELHRRMFWRGMITQAGVALGLARIAATAFRDWGPFFQTAMTGAIIANLAIGPPLFRSALIAVGEAGGGGGLRRRTVGGGARGGSKGAAAGVVAVDGAARRRG